MQIFRFVFIFLITFYAFTSVFAQDGDGETIKVESSIVVLNAAITDVSGKSVSGLKHTQFKIFENGEEQKIDFFAAEQTPFAAVILLDSSGSMEQRISMARSAAINFLDGLSHEYSVAIYNFDS